MVRGEFISRNGNSSNKSCSRPLTILGHHSHHKHYRSLPLPLILPLSSTSVRIHFVVSQLTLLHLSHAHYSPSKAHSSIEEKLVRGSLSIIYLLVDNVWFSFMCQIRHEKWCVERKIVCILTWYFILKSVYFSSCHRGLQLSFHFEGDDDTEVSCSWLHLRHRFHKYHTCVFPSWLFAWLVPSHYCQIEAFLINKLDCSWDYSSISIAYGLFHIIQNVYKRTYMAAHGVGGG